MSYLADTCFLIDLVTGDEGAFKLAEILDSTGQRTYLSVISVEEYLRGVYYLYYNEKSRLKEKLAQANRDLNAFEIIPVSHEIADKAAELDAQLALKGKMLSLSDVYIAATAITHGLTLITRNVRHFTRFSKLKIRKY